MKPDLLFPRVLSASCPLSSHRPVPSLPPSFARYSSADVVGKGSPPGNVSPSTHAQYAPVYDIPIEGKAFPGEVPVFIEVSKVREIDLVCLARDGLCPPRCLWVLLLFPDDPGCVLQILSPEFISPLGRLIFISFPRPSLRSSLPLHSSFPLPFPLPYLRGLIYSAPFFSNAAFLPSPSVGYCP